MTLDEIEVGMTVLYVPPHADGDRTHLDCERGMVTSKNAHYIFVRFKGETSEACRSDDLVQA